MSWWDQGDDVLGDGPADRLTEAWRAILGQRSFAGRQKPTLAETLQAYAAALHASALQSKIGGILLLKGADKVGRFTGEGATAELVQAFSAAIARIELEYQERFHRSPKPSELIGTLEFLLGYDTDVYLSDAAAWPMQDLELRAD